jgi:hypothetical protein
MVREASHCYGKKDRKRADFTTTVVKSVFDKYPEMMRTLEARVIAEELDWENSGYPMYFPDTPELVDMLWRSRVDVRIEDLELPTMPRAFAFAWPNHLVEGVQPVGCLVWWGDGNNWKETLMRFQKRYLQKGLYDISGVQPPDMRLGIHVSFRKEDDAAKKYGLEKSYYRASVPHDLIQSGLASGDNFEATFEKYSNQELTGVLLPTKEEMRVQYVTVKLITRMMVYMKACPEHVREGFPGDRGRKAFETRWTEIGPRVVGSPSHLTDGSHGSPASHLRTWYFRSYPIKKDGTRRNGVVFVRATMVNAEVDPITAEDGGKITSDNS